MNSFLTICGNLRELVLSIKHKLAQMTTNYQKLFLLKSQATILSSQLWLFFGQIPFGVLDIMAGV